MGKVASWYSRFNAPVTALDCGTKCAPHNPSGKPFCCDICHAVPAAYPEEWAYLEPRTDLWHAYRGDECPDPAAQPPEPPANMILLACLGPQACRREYRAVSCRQFPFFPYISSDFRFLGLACEWRFEQVCWVISSLEQVTDEYRQEFVRFYDGLFNARMDEMVSYAQLSEELREEYGRRRRRFPLLHRNGRAYLVSPASDRLQRVEPAQFPKYGYYR